MKNIWLFFFLLPVQVTFSQQYSYDSLNRLIRISYTGDVYITYSYDANGNRINSTVSSAICPSTQASFYAGANDTSNTYQWQVDTGSGFISINDDANYSGSTSAILSVNNAPTTWYGYKYRCLINGSSGISFSNVATLKFASTWIGNKSKAWENPLNWSCGVVPDANIDVVINGNTKFLPKVSFPASCRSLTLGQNTVLYLMKDQLLTITGK